MNHHDKNYVTNFLFNLIQKFGKAKHDYTPKVKPTLTHQFINVIFK